MSRKIIAVIAFKIESSFYEWANKFDSKALYIMHTEFDIKILSKCFSEDDAQKLICIQKTLWENIQNFLQSNICLLYTSPSPRDLWISRMPSSA